MEIIYNVSCIIMQGVAVALPVYFATQRLVDNFSLCYELVVKSIFHAFVSHFFSNEMCCQLNNFSNELP